MKVLAYLKAILNKIKDLFGNKSKKTSTAIIIIGNNNDVDVNVNYQK